MLTELCQELRNWFDRKRYFGTFTIEGGELTVPFLQEGQYFRIIGSVFNDGVHQYPVTSLRDETFDGAIWALAIPEEFVDLASEIEAWQAKYGGADSTAMSPYTSESFGGYSYSKSAANSSSNNSAGISWQTAYANRLNKWRKI